MEVLLYLVPLAIALGGLGLAAFLWSLRSGQYDDLDGAAWRAIADDEPAETSSTPAHPASTQHRQRDRNPRRRRISSVHQDACVADRAGFDNPRRSPPLSHGRPTDQQELIGDVIRCP